MLIGKRMIKKEAYHDIHVEPVGAETDHTLSLGSQVGEVAGEHRGRDFRRRHRNPIQMRKSTGQLVETGREKQKREMGVVGSLSKIASFHLIQSLAYLILPSNTEVEDETQALKRRRSITQNIK